MIRISGGTFWSCLTIRLPTLSRAKRRIKPWLALKEGRGGRSRQSAIEIGNATWTKSFWPRSVDIPAKRASHEFGGLDGHIAANSQAARLGVRGQCYWGANPGRHPLVSAICKNCGLIRTTVANPTREAQLNLQGQCPRAQPTMSVLGEA